MAPPRPRTERWLVIFLSSLDGHGNVVLGDVVRGRLGGVVVENVRRHPCGQKPREVELSWGLAQGLQRTTDTRQGASAPRMSLGRSRQRSSAARGRPSGVASAAEGPTVKILNGPV